MTRASTNTPTASCTWKTGTSRAWTRAPNEKPDHLRAVDHRHRRRADRRVHLRHRAQGAAARVHAGEQPVRNGDLCRGHRRRRAKRRLPVILFKPAVGPLPVETIVMWSTLASGAARALTTSGM